MSANTISTNHASSESFHGDAVSFETAKGSIYKYDPEGRTSRLKTVTGEQHASQDITVFADLNRVDEQEFLETIHFKNQGSTYVVERLPDDKPHIINNLTEIVNPNRLYLGIVRGGKLTKNVHVSLKPKEGWNAFDMRSYEEDGELRIERHLGNKVAKINY